MGFFLGKSDTAAKWFSRMKEGWVGDPIQRQILQMIKRYIGTRDVMCVIGVPGILGKE